VTFFDRPPERAAASRLDGTVAPVTGAGRPDLPGPAGPTGCGV
jgi:hypothetical protein